MARYEVVSVPSMRSLMNWSRERLARTLMDFFRASDAVRDVMAERNRQVTGEGWAPEADDTRRDGELPLAAACYAAVASAQARGAEADAFKADMMISGGGWPWSAEWWKPKDARRNLVRAGALIIAEIERIDRMQISTPKQEG